jgi:RHS repeat-associated protein
VTITTPPPLNEQTTISYNAAGQPASLMDAMGHTTQFGYDAGDLMTVTDPLGNVTRRFPDGAGRPAVLSDALGRQTLYEYDVLNRIKKLTDALGGVTSFGYDQNGNLTSVTDAHQGPSTNTKYEYDNMDRLKTRTDPLLHAETYVYDATGNLKLFTSRKSQATTSTYDGLNRRTKATYADTSSTTYTWDKGNRLTQVADSLGGTITRTYDPLDRLTKETTPQGTVTYTYDAAGRRTTMTVTGQPVVTYDYDNANRLKKITKGTSIVLIDYDPAGRRRSTTLPNSVVIGFAYDVASRMTGIAYQKGTVVLGDLAYAYDAAGNRTQVQGSFARTGLPQVVASASYNAANQQKTFGSQTLTYDLNGNLTGDGIRTYTWNARSQLSAIAAPGLSMTFKYDGLGRRTTKALGGTATNFVYDGITSVQQTGAATVNLLTGLGVDEYFTRTDSAGLRALLPDALGSTIALTDNTGAVQTQYTYEPFGTTTTTGTSSTNPFQYTGREQDSPFLYYYRNRYYSPTFSRFISEDGFRRNGASNLYAYAKNNPLRWIDPMGLWSYATEYGTVGTYLTDDMRRAERGVDAVFNRIGNRDAIVTYTTNGTHMVDSLHYDGNAVDLRTRDLSASDRAEAVQSLRNELGADYRVINEGDHIHIEYRGTGGGGGGGGGANPGPNSPEGGDSGSVTGDEMGGRK